jgi:hypothetical protein
MQNRNYMASSEMQNTYMLVQNIKYVTISKFEFYMNLLGDIGSVMYTSIPIARQQVGKHIPATHAHATIGHLLLGMELLTCSVTAEDNVFHRVCHKAI